MALRRQQVLRAPRQPVQRSAVFPGLRDCPVFGQCHHELQGRVVLFQPLQIHFCQGDRRNLLRPHQFRQFSHARKRQIFQVLRYLRRHARSLRQPHRLPFGFEFHPWQYRIKHQRRIHGIRNVQFVNLLVAFRLVVQTLQHHFLVFIGNRHVRDRRRVVDHFFRNLFCALGFRLRPQHARKQRSRQAHP